MAPRSNVEPSRRLTAKSSSSRSLSSSCARKSRAFWMAALADSPSASTSWSSSGVNRRSSPTVVMRRMPCAAPPDRSGRLRHVFCRQASIARRRSSGRAGSEMCSCTASDASRIARSPGQSASAYTLPSASSLTSGGAGSSACSAR